jgi:hypothetical protein
VRRLEVHLTLGLNKLGISVKTLAMKNEAGVSRLGVLLGITLVALVVSILWNLKPKAQWKHPVHVVLQNTDPDASNPNNNDKKDKLVKALGKLPRDTFNVEWYGVPIPEDAPGTGDPSCDSGRPNSHVTQQVSFQKAAKLQKFLDDAGIK